MLTSLHANTQMPNKNYESALFDEDTMNEIMRLKMVESRRKQQLNALKRMSLSKQFCTA